MLSHDEFIKLIIWTMTEYGSPAMEKKYPGSMLRQRAEYIYDTLRQIFEVQLSTEKYPNISVSVRHFSSDLDLSKHPLAE